MTIVAFDFDGTLSEDEMTVLLGERKNVADRMASITQQAMNDEIEYAESLRQRIALLEDLPGEEVGAAFDKVELRPGAADVLTEVSNAGNTTAILTGAFVRGVRHVLDREGAAVDVMIANTLEVENGHLTGEVSGPLVEGTKDIALRALADDRGVTLAETVAIGDGANDLPMLRAAGLAIGFDPKPAVRDACDVTVTSMDELRSVLVERGHL